MDDVNNGAVNPVTSSVAQGPETDLQPQTQHAPSAETLNTDVHDGNRVSESIPYDRFQEINTKYREATARLQQFEALQSNYAAYQQLDQIMGQNPALASEVMALLQKSRQAQFHGTVPQQSPEQAPQMPASIVRMAENLYLKEFRDHARAQGVQGTPLEFIERAARELIGHLNPDPVGNFDLGIVPELFKRSKQILDNFYTKMQSEYIQDKRNQIMPPSTSQLGSAPVAMQPQLKTQADQARFFAQELKRQGFGS